MGNEQGGGRDSRQEVWARRIEAWRASGQTQAGYCRRESLKRDQFVYWKRRLDELTAGKKGPAAIEVVEVAPQRPAMMRAAAGWPMPSGIAIEGFGWRVGLAADFDEDTLRRVLGVLEAPR